MAQYPKPVSIQDELRALKARVKALETNNRSASSSIPSTGGALTVRGASGQEIKLHTPDGLARIDMTSGDSGDGTHATMIAFGSSVLLQRESDGTRNPNGGFLQFDTGTAFVGSRDDDKVGTWWALGPGPGGSAILIGRWFPDAHGSGRSGVFCGQFSAPGTTTGITISYGATMLTTMGVIAQVTTSSALDWWVDPASITSTGFTISWTSASNVSGYYWAFRM